MKTETKFTPGPWHSGEPFIAAMQDRGTCKFIGIGSGSTHIGYASITGLVGNQEAKANARLIAAAPDLYDALRGILRHMPEDEWGKEACAALAKAEGKQ